MRGLRSLLSNQRGMAALEFALLLPIMIMLIFGTYELSQYVRAQQKVDIAAQAIVDMVAQQAAGVTGGTSGSLGNFCQAGLLMMTPFATTTGNSSFKVAIASVTNYSSSGPALDWESDAACPSTAAALGSTAITLATSPTNLIPTAGAPGDSVILVTVTYVYSSPVQYFFPGLFTMTHTSFARPRNNSVVTCTAPCS